MDTIQTFKDIISIWDSAADFGREIGIPEISARAMKQRNRIPSKYWDDTVIAAKKKGVHQVTHEFLAKLSAGKSTKELKKPKSN